MTEVQQKNEKKNNFAPISPFSKSAYEAPETKKKMICFQKFYSKVKVSTQTRRMSTIGGFYDKNSLL